MRLAQEDATQLMNVYPSAKYDLEFSQVALAMLEFCSARSVAALELFKLLVFNYLIGNGDAHAKNFSLLEGPKGQWVVSPGYDLLCTRFYDDRTMALPLYGENSGWKRVLLLKLSKELDLPEPLASKVLDQQLQALAALPEEISNGVLGFPQHLRFDVASFLRKRAKSLSE
jgi:serine/threonine-protein kinase HipA